MAYRDISIDEHALNLLPVDENVMDTLQTVVEPVEQEDCQTDDFGDGRWNSAVKWCFNSWRRGQSERIDLHLQDTHKQNPISWQKTSVTAVDELTTEFHVVRAFPPYSYEF